MGESPVTKQSGLAAGGPGQPAPLAGAPNPNRMETSAVRAAWVPIPSAGRRREGRRRAARGPVPPPGPGRRTSDRRRRRPNLSEQAIRPRAPSTGRGWPRIGLDPIRNSLVPARSAEGPGGWEGFPVVIWDRQSLWGRRPRSPGFPGRWIRKFTRCGCEQSSSARIRGGPCTRRRIPRKRCWPPRSLRIASPRTCSPIAPARSQRAPAPDRLGRR